MNQEERDIRLLEYWQGESLSPEEVREVETWLDEKVENRRYFEDLQREFLRQHWAMRGDSSRFFPGTVVSFNGGRGGVGIGTEVVA